MRGLEIQKIGCLNKYGFLKMNKMFFCILALFLLMGIPYAEAAYFDRCKMDYKDKASQQCTKDLLLVTAQFAQSALEAIPSISPSEQEWLDTEINSGNVERSFNAVGSKEFVFKEFREQMLEISLLVEKLSSNDNSIKLQTLLWAELLSNMNDISPFHLNRLKINGIDIGFTQTFAPACQNRNTDNEDKESFGHCYQYYLNDFYSKIILNTIIIHNLEKIITIE